MDTGTQIFLLVAVGTALAFEFVNGFHDTANAVATVIYTRSLPPRVAVLWSGLMNFLGVHLGGIAVAYAIVNLLPIDLVVGSHTHEGRAMVFALLTSAIVWNVLTWWRGLPASSSHALIGSILGVGIANAWMRGLPLGAGVNWAKVTEIGISLMFSPMLGFICAAVLLMVARKVFTSPELHTPQTGERPPPPAVRATLFLTCTGVSLAHGSNDGQKGVGLIMLILISVLPARFALDPHLDRARIERAVRATHTVEEVLARVPASPGAGAAPASAIVGLAATETPARGAGDGTPALPAPGPLVAAHTERVRRLLSSASSASSVAEADRFALRESILRISSTVAAVEKRPRLALSAADRAALSGAHKDLRAVTDYAPEWVLMAVALALGIGTTVGWKRIVVTVGEKIGKTHMTYAQGATAELVAMGAIGLAASAGMPVSTTHVLASGIAGTMAAQRSGLQAGTLKSIALAWVLTLPVTMGMAAALFPLYCWVLR